MIVTVYGCAVIIVALYFFILNLLNSIWIRNHTQKTYTVSGPKVSVLIPARNEEKNIEACVVSFLRQSYQNYEIIVLDDNSEDATGQILERLQKENPSILRIIKGKPLKTGWNGKPYAMHQLTDAAQGEIFLCTDADTVHSKDSVAWAVTQLEYFHADMISGYVNEKLETFGECMTVPVMYDASSEARNPTAAATSSGVPKRPAGMSFLSSFSSRSLVMSVDMKPGATAFTVTFFLAVSCARAFVAAIRPPFAAE